MKLSVNLNKIALLRNARGENYPDLKYFANKAIDLGVDGLTLHPRPDHRHATSNDVIELSQLAKERGVEFNIEGNPFSKPNNEFKGFCELVEMIAPDQITLVPDTINQITSDHGWMSGSHDEDLKTVIRLLKKKSNNAKISLFIDDINGVNFYILRKTAFGWIITCVVVGLTSGLLTGQGIYGPTVPNLVTCTNNSYNFLIN